MDDLISRRVAIDALTDTNLKRNVDSVCDGDMNRTRRAAQRVIANLPAVNAVPVNWISAYMNKAYGRVRAEIIREMVDAWMEQEQI